MLNEDGMKLVREGGLAKEGHKTARYEHLARIDVKGN
jgi:hypothetical protein